MSEFSILTALYSALASSILGGVSLIIYIWQKNEKKINIIDNLAPKDFVKNQSSGLKQELLNLQQEREKTYEAREESLKNWVSTKISKAVIELKDFFFAEMRLEVSEIKNEIKDLRHLIKNVEKGKVGQMDIYLSEFNEIKNLLKQTKLIKNG